MQKETELAQLAKILYKKKFELTIGAVTSVTIAALFYFIYTPTFKPYTQIQVRQPISYYQLGLLTKFPLTVPELQSNLSASNLDKLVSVSSIDISPTGSLSINIENHQKLEKEHLRLEFNKVVQSTLNKKVIHFQENLERLGVWDKGQGQFEAGRFMSKIFETKVRIKQKTTGNNKYGAAFPNEHLRQNIQLYSVDEVQSAAADIFRYIATLRTVSNKNEDVERDLDQIISNTDLLLNLYNVIQKVPDITLLSDFKYTEPTYVAIKTPEVGSNMLVSGTLFVLIFGTFIVVTFARDSINSK